MSNRKLNTFRPSLMQLESREVPTVTSVTNINHILTVKLNNGNTAVLVTQTSSTIKVVDDTVDKTWSYPAAQVSSINIIPGNGNDTLTAQSTATNPKLVTFNGKNTTGNDDFVGDSGPVSMIAGSGKDTLSAPAGNDTLQGGSGTDTLKGGSGNDSITAGAGTSYLYGGTGNATLNAGVGNDTIVAMNGAGTDVVNEGLGNGVIWVDGVGADNVSTSSGNYVIQSVSSFVDEPNATSTALTATNIVEPTTILGVTYEAFTNRPLFASGGPTAQDVSQYITSAANNLTNLDDSWLLAGLAAIAQQDPATIEHDVVSFGDGTYGVELGGNLYRVDNELPVNVAGETFLAYASVGQQNSLWVPIVEKAFAYYASTNGTPSYANLLSANGATTADVYAAFGATDSGSIPLSGAGSFANATELGSSISTLFGEGYSLSINIETTGITGTSVATGATVTLQDTTSSTTATGNGREYAVLGYTQNLHGVVTGVILYDTDGRYPSGIYVTLNTLFNTAAAGSLDFGNP